MAHWHHRWPVLAAAATCNLHSVLWYYCRRQTRVTVDDDDSVCQLWCDSDHPALCVLSCDCATHVASCPSPWASLVIQSCSWFNPIFPAVIWRHWCCDLMLAGRRYGFFQNRFHFVRSIAVSDFAFYLASVDRSFVSMKYLTFCIMQSYCLGVIDLLIKLTFLFFLAACLWH